MSHSLEAAPAGETRTTCSSGFLCCSAVRSVIETLRGSVLSLMVFTWADQSLESSRADVLFRK